MTTDEWVRGDWIQTFTGRQFYPLAPRPEDVDIEDIANALSMQCRYGGHSSRFYSVAEHCVHLSNWFSDQKLALIALMHDAAEAYLVDVPRPLKKQLVGYHEAEARLEKAIFERFAVPYPIDEAVKTADTRILMDERAVLMREPKSKWTTECDPLGVTIQCWTPERARFEFLERFYHLIFGWRDLA